MKLELPAASNGRPRDLAVTKLEVDAIKTHLRSGGRWPHFTYPRAIENRIRFECEFHNSDFKLVRH